MATASSTAKLLCTTGHHIAMRAPFAARRTEILFRSRTGIRSPRLIRPQPCRSTSSASPSQQNAVETASASPKTPSTTFSPHSTASARSTNRPSQQPTSSSLASPNASATNTTPSLKPNSSTTSTTSTSTSTTQPPSPPTYTTPPTIATKTLSLLLRPIRSYSRVADSRPYITQLLSSLVIYTLGDLISQYIRSSSSPPTLTTSTTSAPSASASSASFAGSTTATPPEPPTQSRWEQYSPRRTLNSALIGSLASLPSYIYFLRLSSLSIPLPSILPLALRKPTTIALKVTLNQLTFAFLINSWFFAAHHVLAHPSSLLTHPTSTLAQAWQRVKDTVPGAWLTGLRVWPVFMVLNLWVVPVRFRSLAAGGVAVGWQGYLGWVDLRTRRSEAGHGEIGKGSKVRAESEKAGM